jgi:hypothetical protein
LKASGDDAPSIEKTAGSSPDPGAVPSETAPVQPPPSEAGQPEQPRQPKDESGDAVEADLERRVADSELAGRTTVANALAKRLDAHRAAKAAGNVALLRPRQQRA